MSKVFLYELKRIFSNWLFWVMFVVNCIFSWYVLTTDIIAGIAYTAPFSVWSFCAYTGKVMLFTIITILLMLSGYYGKKQKQVEILTAATPITPVWQLLIRSGVLTVCFIFLYAAAVVLAAVFYIRFFRFHDFGPFLLPAILIVLPCFVCAIGLGHLLGRLHQSCIHLLVVACFMAEVSITKVFDFFCAGYFQVYPLALSPNSEGEPDFILSPVWLTVRLLYLLTGLGMLILSGVRVGRKSGKA